MGEGKQRDVERTHGFDVRNQGAIRVLDRDIKCGVVGLSWSVMRSRSCQRKYVEKMQLNMMKCDCDKMAVRRLDLI